MDNIPPGMTEADVLNTIEQVIRPLAHKFTFPGYDREDIAQEAFLMALDALPRYKPAVGPLANFLYAHIKRRLINFKRDHFKRADPTCPSCHAAEMEGRRPEHPDGQFCAAYRAWKARNDAKTALAMPIAVESPEYSEQTVEDSSYQSEADEILRMLDRELPVELRSTYLALKSGVKGIPKAQREVVEREVRRILQRAGVPMPATVRWGPE